MLYSTFLLNTLQNELFLHSINTYYARGKSIKREVRAPSKRRSRTSREQEKEPFRGGPFTISAEAGLRQTSQLVYLRGKYH